MSDVLVCAEPETREEATRFVSQWGARPRICSVNRLKRWRGKAEKTTASSDPCRPSRSLSTGMSNPFDLPSENL